MLCRDLPATRAAPSSEPFRCSNDMGLSIQVVNHFYGMFELYRKKGLARNLAAMAAEAPDDYANLTP